MQEVDKTSSYEPEGRSPDGSDNFSINKRTRERRSAKAGRFFSRMKAATVKKSQRMSDLNGKKRQKKHI